MNLTVSIVILKMVVRINDLEYNIDNGAGGQYDYGNPGDGGGGGYENQYIGNQGGGNEADVQYP